MRHIVTREELDRLTYRIIGAAIEVHKRVGPGLLESLYQKCMKQEFLIREIQFDSELLVPLEYKGFELDAELRCDFLVEDSIVVELKATDLIAPVFEAQVLTYMKILEVPKGILINFNCVNLFKEGQRTYVNELYRKLPLH